MLFPERIPCRCKRDQGIFIPGIGRWIMVANVIGDIALVLVVSSLLGALARRCGQPTVMGPMPVLAAIVRERGLAGTTAGEIATAVAATMDALAWLVLAAALIGTGQSGHF